MPVRRSSPACHEKAVHIMANMKGCLFETTLPEMHEHMNAVMVYSLQITAILDQHNPHANAKSTMSITLVA